MTACPVCHRLKRPTGMHICVPGVRGLTVAPTPAPGHDRSASTEFRRLNAIRLPGDGAAAAVWNALVDGGKRG